MSFVPRALFSDSRVLHALSCLSLSLVLALGVGACGKSKRSQLFNENLRPVVAVDSVVVDTTQTQPDTWHATIAWSATDADGRAARLEYAIDPTTEDTSWVAITTSPIVLTFPVRARNAQGYIEPEFRVVVLRARDDRNEASPVVAVPIYAANEPPLVTIVQPLPSAQFAALLPGSFSVLWEGVDPDGYPSHAPKAYRTRLVLEGDPLFTQVESSPDALLRDGEVTEWQAWSLVDSAAGGKRFQGVANQQNGYLAVLAIDQSGAQTQHLVPGVNLQRFQISELGPAIQLSASSAAYTFDPSAPGYQPTLSLEVPMGRLLQLSWSATPRTGSRVDLTRWRLDPVDLADSTERQSPDDLQHWASAPGSVNAAVLPSLSAGPHRFIVEAIDSQRRRTVATLLIQSIAPLTTRDLLIIDDTRREADQTVAGGCLRAYTKPWPSASELDTFLYARGGVPWRCVQSGVSVNSVAGLFAGFSFDTLGTRLGLTDPARAVTLSRLLDYRHVIWLVDSDAAQISDALDQRIFPITALRAMSKPGHQNVLRDYLSAGGDVWMAGSGAALATLLDYDVRSNNLSPHVIFNVAAGEMTPDRMLFAEGHLRCTIAAARLGGLSFERAPEAVGGWTGHGVNGTLSAPDYTRLPVSLRTRDAGTDPLPPTRLSTQSGLYYPGSLDVEYLLDGNNIREDMDPDRDVVRMETTLDTLMRTVGVGILQSPAPAMTYYHGRENGSVVFTGFSLWQSTRPDAQALVDFVLSDIWKLSRAGNPGVSGPALQARPRPARVIGTRRGVR